MMLLTKEQLSRCSPHTPASLIDVYLEPINQTLLRYDITTPERIAAYIAQTAHESANFTRINENLNYSAESLLRVFKKYFTPTQAQQYARQPERIANRVYANRMGNGDEASGDGWKYRGFGHIQLTGKNNFAAFSKDTGIDIVSNPEKNRTHALAALTAGWFWDKNNLNLWADVEDLLKITTIINGGLNGWNERLQNYERCKKVLNIE